MVWEGSHRGAAQSASRLRACLSPAAGLACLRAARGAGCIRAPWAEVSVCPRIPGQLFNLQPSIKKRDLLVPLSPIRSLIAQA